jgi:putative transcriptional regulator
MMEATMDKHLFRELMTSAGEALEHAQGKRALRTTELPAPPKPMTAAEIRAIRERVNASQAVFARYLNVSTKLVQAWEAGRRTPEGPALKLLRIGGDNPKVVFAGARGTPLKAGKLYVVRSRTAEKVGIGLRKKRTPLRTGR